MGLNSLGIGKLLPHDNPITKISRLYPKMFKPCAVIPCLKKIEKTYKLRDAPIEFS